MSETKVTETSTVTIEEERREGRILRKLIELWPLWLTVLGGIAACFKFYFTVTDLDAGQKKWQASSEQRREKNHDEMEDLRIRMTRLECDNEWIKRSLKP